MATVPKPPAKPRGWSEKRYRDTYDATPVTVIAANGTEYRCCGAVSGYVIAKSMPGSTVVSSDD